MYTTVIITNREICSTTFTVHYIVLCYLCALLHTHYQVTCTHLSFFDNIVNKIHLCHKIFALRMTES